MRVIPLLLHKDHDSFKGVNYKNHIYLGDILNQIRILNDYEVDELTIINIEKNFNERKNLNLIGSELISVLGLEKGVNPSDEVTLEIKYASGDIKKIKTLCRIDTKNELEYYKNGGILQYVLRNMI